MIQILKKLIENPSEFTPKDASLYIDYIIKGESTPSQISAFLIALKLHQFDRSPLYIDNISISLMQYSLPLNNTGYTVDIVGTGGDGQNTFNVSTASAIVVSGCGLKVAKHGNRASSSQCGSGDVLEALGCNLTNTTPKNINLALEKGGFAFLFCQVFHPAMSKVSSIRKEINVKTIFNILGPLMNPSNPNAIIVGVHSKDLGKIMAETLLSKNILKFWVVWGNVGLDEISTQGMTTVWKCVEGNIIESTLSPIDFGLQEHPLSEVKGGDASFNANLMKSLLNDELNEGHPILDFVLMNSAALLVVSEAVNDLKQGVEMARRSIKSKKAKSALDCFIELTK